MCRCYAQADATADATLLTSASRGRSGKLSAATIQQYIRNRQATTRPYARHRKASALSEGELEEVLLSCDQELAALLLLCAHAGLRIGEALQVRTGDFAGRMLTVHGKGGKVRHVPLGRRVREAVQSVVPKPDGRLFDWTYSQAAYRMRKASRTAGYPEFWRGFHAVRKTSSTRLYQKVGDFTRVAVFLGHSSVDTTRKYVAVMEDDIWGE